LPLRILPLARCGVLPMPPALLTAVATVTAGYSAQSVVPLACRGLTGAACAASCSMLSDHVKAWWDVSVLLGAAYDPAHTAWIAVWGALTAVLLAPWLGLLTRWFGKAFIGKAAINLATAPLRQRLLRRPAAGTRSSGCCAPPPDLLRVRTTTRGLGSITAPWNAGEFKAEAAGGGKAIMVAHLEGAAAPVEWDGVINRSFEPRYAGDGRTKRGLAD